MSIVNLTPTTTPSGISSPHLAKTNEILKRSSTAIVGIPLLIILLTQALSAAVAAFLGLAQLVFTSEFSRIIFPGSPKDRFNIDTVKAATAVAPMKSDSTASRRVICILLSSGIFAINLMPSGTESYTATATALLAAMLVGAFFRGSISERVASCQSVLLCVVYTALTWVSLWKLFQFGGNGLYVIFALVIFWASDTAALFVGRRWGRHKLAPVISPNKTWEGAAAGLLASIGCAALMVILYPWLFSTPLVATLVGALAGATGQLGDLFKSIFKRHRGVKDSGKIIPGHGGIVDRLDSVLMAAPVIWLAVSIFGGKT